MLYCIICGQQIYQQAFLNWLCQSLFLSIFFPIDFTVEKFWLLHIALYRNSLTICTSGDSQYTYTPITNLSACACSLYIQDNSQSKVPGHSVNISKIYHDLTYLII